MLVSSLVAVIARLEAVLASHDCELKRIMKVWASFSNKRMGVFWEYLGSFFRFSGVIVVICKNII